jgi:hypothetical protein
MEKILVVFVGRSQVRTRRSGAVVVGGVAGEGVPVGGGGAGLGWEDRVEKLNALLVVAVVVVVVAGVRGEGVVVGSEGVEAGIQTDTAVLPCAARHAGRAVCKAGYSGTQTR